MAAYNIFQRRMGARKRRRSSILMSDMDASGDRVGMMMPFKNVPDDLIGNILSRLPVKCVLRCRCVCKSWRIITHQKFFIDKHQKRNKGSQIVYEYEKEYKSKGGDELYMYRAQLNGLVLEENKNRCGDFRIRNPATKQVLDQVVADSMLCNPLIYFDSSTGIYKVISFYFTDGDLPDVFVRLSSIGTDDDGGDLSLRPSDVPLKIGWGRSVRLICIHDVCYAVNFCFDAPKETEIFRFTIDGKTSDKINLPQSFQLESFPRHEYEGLYVFSLGDDKLSIGIIFQQEELHLWVLEDYNKHIWSEKKLIHLDFIKDYPNPGKIALVSSPSLGQLRIVIANQYVEYDIESKKLTCLAEVPPGKRIMYGIIPSLVSLKGMRSQGTNLSENLLADEWLVYKD